jgi:PAS domain S-box-containing protein
MCDEKNILLVEDEIAIAQNQKVLLGKYGFNVIVAKTEEEAVQAVEGTRKINLILMNVALSNGMDGILTAKTILEKFDIPLIFISARPDANILEKTERLTSYGYIDKNSGETALVAAIKMALRLFESKMKKLETLSLRESAYENSMVPIVVIDCKAYAIIDCNKAAVKIYGYAAKDEITGRTPAELSPPFQYDGTSSSEKIKYYVEKALSEEQIIFEWLYQRPNGSLWDAEVQLKSFIDKGNQLAQFTLADISDRKKTELSLYDSESRIKSFSNNFTSGMIYQIVMKPDGARKFTYLSDSVQLLYGVSPEEAIADETLIYGRIYKDDIPGLTRAEEEAVKTFSTFKVEARVKDPVGKIRWSSFVSTPRLLNDGSICFDGIEFVITERKNTEEALLESETKYRNVVENSIVGVYIIQSGLFRYVNKQFCKMFGYTYDEIINKLGPMDITYPDDRTVVNGNIMRRINGEVEFMEYEFRAVRKDNRVISVRVLGSYMVHQGNPAITGTITDITEQKQAEEGLKKSEALLRTLIDILPDLVWLKDSDGVYLKCNQRFGEMFGAKENMIVGKTDYDFVDREKADFFREKDRAAATAGGPTINEEEVTFKDGHNEILETIKTPIYAADGKLIGVLGISRDITERKKTEEKLRENQRFLTTLIGNFPGMVYRCQNNEEWTMDFVSEGSIAVTGYSPEQLMNSKVISYGNLVYPEDRQMVWNVVQSGILNARPFRMEYRIIDALGKEKWVWEQGCGVRQDSGELLWLEGFISDITERKHAEEALKESEELFKNILDYAPYSIILTDMDYRYKLANKAFYSLNNLSEAETIGKTTEELGFVVEPEISKFLATQMDENGKIENLEMPLVDKNGRKIVFLYSSLVIQWKNQPMILISNVDITEKKMIESELEKYRDRLELLVKERTEELAAANEELQTINEELMEQREELRTTLDKLKAAQKRVVQSEKMASLGIFAAGIAHEINNPLNFINGGVYGLERYFRENLSGHIDNVALLIKAINVGVKRAAEIVASLSNYSGRYDLPPTNCNIRSIIDNCLVILDDQLKNRISVKKNYTDIPAALIGNERKFHQAFYNILSNAEQSIAGKGEIDIDAKVIDKELIITIKDSGCGISPENLPKIFDPFFTTKDPGKGTGLGLSITYNIIEEYKGTLEYETKLNKGTKAIIKLPINNSGKQ